MLRRIAVVGDTLTSGGVILPYGNQMDFMFHGHQVALIGGEAYCGTCKSTGIIIKAGGPARLNYMNAREVALDRDIVLCKCQQHPQIIAIHAGDSTVDDEAEKYSAMANATSASTSSARDVRTQSEVKHDEQFTLYDATGKPMPETFYTVRLSSGELAHGVTDSSGRTERHATSNAQNIRLYLGHREVA
ncbi:PAAR domain-containing protein [Paraburkholderia humisilvae]|uniref:PAAR domain-containing protein n=1 Tax=Paraburkholderia humisilvae TaxID=627669 RepID=A0A6J5DDZ4_9BURK|nr:PAAR domain-containing protein [Paraburkholderia humisilvae]CAB3752520.1 hypothetical protein LMG29542_01790 [Paraburkholderia humisilvae]